MNPDDKTRIGRYGGIPVYAEDVNAVPVDELKGLAEQWEEYGEAPDVACARELREVIARYD